MKLTRRSAIECGLLAAAGAGGAFSVGRSGAAELEPTPECDDGDAPTISQTAGPFFTPNSPLKHDFRADAVGEALTLTGFVLGADCAPIAGALIDLWHANAAGDYDNRGYLLRGHQLTDAGGRFRFETIRPGLYPGRTRHFHLKLQRPRGRVLTTQLYFPGEPRNARDRIFDQRLLMRVGADAAGKTARYDFVLR
jgi:protocatechuate 3,4-dioxygenase beta subunit